MHPAGFKVASWHLRQDVACRQVSRRGTREFWIGSIACSNSRTPGLPRNKKGTKLVLYRRVHGMAGVLWVAGTVELLLLMIRNLDFSKETPELVGLRRVQGMAGVLWVERTVDLLRLAVHNLDSSH